MLRNALLTLLILVVYPCYAQQNYFVLIQADNSQPFYVRLEDKTLSSTAKGHLILAQLTEGSHSIVIGFPKQLFPEQQYSFNINGKDLEFQLKDQGDKGWGLFNPKTEEWLTPDKKEPANTARIEGVKKDDAFSRLMAGVVGDTAVMYNTYVSALPDTGTARSSAAVARTDMPRLDMARPDTALSHPDTAHSGTTLVRPDTAVTRPDNTIAHQDLPPARPDTVVAHPDSALAHADTVIGRQEPAKTAVVPHPVGTVVKLSEHQTAKGLRLAFALRQKGKKTDTVVVIIPMDSSLAVESPVIQSDTSRLTPAPVATGQVSEYKSDTLHLYVGPRKETPKGPDTAMPVPATVHNNASGSGSGELYRKPDSSQKKEAAKVQLVNSDCRNFATDYDVDKLRVKMLEISKDEDKILTAKKIFKTKCFTTKQIKALSEVFTSDGAKYRFFEAAYPFVADDHFRELADLLADPVYNGKFRAMTGQR